MPSLSLSKSIESAIPSLSLSPSAARILDCKVKKLTTNINKKTIDIPKNLCLNLFFSFSITPFFRKILALLLSYHYDYVKTSFN